MNMNRPSDNIYRPAAFATLFLMAQTQAKAQDDIEEDEGDIGFGEGRSSSYIEEEDVDLEDMPMYFSYRRYRHEINYLLLLVLALLLTNRLIIKRHHRGCSIIVVFIIIIYYILDRVLRFI